MQQLFRRHVALLPPDTHSLFVPDYACSLQHASSAKIMPLTFISFLLGLLLHSVLYTTILDMSALTIALVPGAFHGEWAMDLLAAQLQGRGYDTRTWGLKTVNKPNVSVEEDSTLLAEGLLKPLVEQCKDVVLYLHSYAGFPGSVAIAGLSKVERSSKGLQGGIIGLIFQSAFVPKAGDTILKMLGGNYAPWQDLDVSLFHLFIDAFYHGLY